jgi:2-oxoglutarate ferredoxin oxidoreductase subunit alpha
VRSLFLPEGELEAHNKRLQEKWQVVASREVRFEERMTEDCDVLMVAYGTSARIAKGALASARSQGIRAGLLRPISLWPFPSSPIASLATRIKGVLVVEMSSGQMLEDVHLAIKGKAPVHFEGRMGGGVPTESDVLRKLKEMAG